MKERRKSERYHIPFDVGIIHPEKPGTFIAGEVQDFSSDGFNFESEHLPHGLNDEVHARFQVYSNTDHIYIFGRLAWKVQLGDTCSAGIEITEINVGNNENLGFPFNLWNDKIK